MPAVVRHGRNMILPVLRSAHAAGRRVITPRLLWFLAVIKGVHRGEHFLIILYGSKSGLRRGGLTPASASAHGGDGRGCRKIEPISATVLPRDARRIFHG